MEKIRLKDKTLMPQKWLNKEELGHSCLESDQTGDKEAPDFRKQVSGEYIYILHYYYTLQLFTPHNRQTP